MDSMGYDSDIYDIIPIFYSEILTIRLEIYPWISDLMMNCDDLMIFDDLR
jgi:hypothetical protein